MWTRYLILLFDLCVRLRPEDVGYDIQATLTSASTSPPGPGGNLQAHAAPNPDNEGDPLVSAAVNIHIINLNIIIKLV